MTTEINTPPVTGWAQTEIDVASNAAIKNIAKEFSDAALADEAGTMGDPGVTADPAITPDPAATPGVPVPPPTDTAGEVAKALERSDVRVEIERFQLEQRLQALEMENKLLRDKENTGQALPLDMGQLPMALRTKPLDTLTRLGVNPDELIRVALAQKLGDKATPELRKAVTEATTDAKIAALEAQLHSMSQKEAQRAYFDQVNASAADFVRKLGDRSEAPTVSRVAKADGARVHAEIMDEILKDAQARAGREPNGALLTYEDALKRVETRWSAYSKLLSGVSQPAAGAPVTPASTTQSTASTPTQKPVTQSPGTAIKSPDRPLPPWLQKQASEADGIKAAVQEFIRAESAQK
jgi:hypothetical protein